MWFWLLWWTFDDHLADALNAPGLGKLAIWVPFLIGIALSINGIVSRVVNKIEIKQK